VTKRVRWQACRILPVYRYRWTGGETYHGDGKQEPGMGDSRLRNGRGQRRQVYLVMPVYSLLMSRLKQGPAKDWAPCRLTIIGEACRVMISKNLRTTLAWAIEQVAGESRSHDHVVASLRLR